jgi:cell division protein ZapE
VTLTARYHAELARHGFAADAAQLAAVVRLEELRARLARAARREARAWWRLGVALGRVAPRRAVRGLYLWGGVGRGKTLLMDLFATALEVPARRAHFHRFMHDVHARLAALRPLALADPLARVAADLAGATRVLCLDELYVSDIADAMLLAGLFAGLIERGVTLVITSNVPPAELYRDGLQRSRFVPAIRLLERVTLVLEVDGGVDYRLRQLERAPLYVEGAGAAADAVLAERFAAIAGDTGGAAGTIEVEDRPISVRRRCDGAIWFDFGALCAGPRGTADYIAIACQHHTVVVSGVPLFDAATENEARRFIALVDEFYERGVKLLLSAAATPERLYRGERLAREFQRTASRLAEMQSHDYLARPHRP